MSESTTGAASGVSRASAPAPVRVAMAPPTAPVRELLPAGMSPDPEVHHLIADLFTAEMNGDTATAARCAEAINARGYYI